MSSFSSNSTTCCFSSHTCAGNEGERGGGRKGKRERGGGGKKGKREGLVYIKRHLLLKPFQTEGCSARYIGTQYVHTQGEKLKQSIFVSLAKACSLWTAWVVYKISVPSKN